MISYFAPAERLDREAVSRQRFRLKENFPLESVFSRLDMMVLVLNRQRQILESYPDTALFGDGNLLQAIGLRPGEALGCVHSRTMEAGCGTSRACRYCGVVQAIQECFEEGIPVKRRCMLRIEGDSREEGVEYQVSAVPFPSGSEDLILLFFEDRSDETRRRVMERLFFHDVLNTATGLRMYLELLSRKNLTEDLSSEVEKLLGISKLLIEEIDDQKTLAGAENGTLQVRRDFVHSVDLLTSLKNQYLGLAEEKGISIEVGSFSEVFSVISDVRLLRRVIGNMVKNAVEASSGGDTVVLNCGEKDGRSRFSVWNPGVIPEDVSLRIFTRSFSTKGENRGLGTYSMKLLGEGYLGGQVGFRSSPDDGTEFFISFVRKSDPFDS